MPLHSMNYRVPEMFKFLRRVRWFNLAVLTITPLVGLYGIVTTPLSANTLIWSFVCYVFSMIGELAIAVEIMKEAQHILRDYRRFVCIDTIGCRRARQLTGHTHATQVITASGPTDHTKPLCCYKYCSY